MLELHRHYPLKAGDHKPAALRAAFEKSLSTLGVPKVRTFYLHAPDRSVLFEETLEEVDKIYREGKFEQLGLSNFAAWEVAEVVGICQRRSFVKPAIYQASRFCQTIFELQLTSLNDALRAGHVQPHLARHGARAGAVPAQVRHPHRDVQRPGWRLAYRQDHEHGQHAREGQSIRRQHVS